MSSTEERTQRIPVIVCLQASSLCSLLSSQVNQIGTVSESIQAANDSVLNGRFGVMVSHRSGETEDTTIADLAVGLAAGQVRRPIL